MNIASNYGSFGEWLNLHPVLVGLIIIWSLFWKGLALWRAAERQQKFWFIAILVLNTIGLLEIIYLFFVSRKYEVEVIDQSGN